MEIKHRDTLGYAGFIDGHRVTGYYACRSVAERMTERLIEKAKEEQRLFDERWAAETENERRIDMWINSLLKKRNYHFSGSRERHFDKKLWNAMKISEKHKAKKAQTIK